MANSRCGNASALDTAGNTMKKSLCKNIERKKQSKRVNLKDHFNRSIAHASREDYVKANFEFALIPQTRCRALHGCNDLFWDEVELVMNYAEDGQASKCAICLDFAKVKRSTLCGHIFCLLCLLRLFEHSGEIFSRCPVCFTFISKADLRRATDLFYEPNRVAVGDFLKFSLLKVSYSGTVPVVANGEVGDYYSPILPSIDSNRAMFSRMCLESRDNVRRVCAIEDKEIKEQYVEARKYGDQTGLRLLRSVEENIQRILRRWSDLEPCALASYDYVEEDNVDKSRHSLPPSTAFATLEKIDRTEKDYFFYQLEDSRLVFLDPFNVRCFHEEFGTNVENLPRLVSGRVVAVENVVVTSESGRRFPFLAHLPPFSSILFVELALDHIAGLSEETINIFKEEAKIRAKARRMLRKKEKRRENRMKQNNHEMSYSELLSQRVDYKDWFARRREKDAMIAEQLRYGFNVTLSGEIVPSEMNADLIQDENSMSELIDTDKVHLSKSYADVTVKKEKDEFPPLFLSNELESTSQENYPGTDSAWSRHLPKVSLDSGSKLGRSPPAQRNGFPSKSEKVLYTNSVRRKYN